RSRASNARAAPWPSTAMRCASHRRTCARRSEPVLAGPASFTNVRPHAGPVPRGSDNRGVNDLSLFLPCAAGVEDFLAQEVHAHTGRAGDDLLILRGGVRVRATWREALQLNLHSRLAQRVLIELAHVPYRSENDLYAIASDVA